MLTLARTFWYKTAQHRLYILKVRAFIAQDNHFFTSVIVHTCVQDFSWSHTFSYAIKYKLTAIRLGHSHFQFKYLIRKNLIVFSGICLLNKLPTHTPRKSLSKLFSSGQGNGSL